MFCEACLRTSQTTRTVFINAQRRSQNWKRLFVNPAGRLESLSTFEEIDSNELKGRLHHDLGEDEDEPFSEANFASKLFSDYVGELERRKRKTEAKRRQKVNNEWSI